MAVSLTILSSSQLNKIPSYMIPQTCIVTDSTAQFPNDYFPGHDLIQVMPLHVRMGTKTFADSADPKEHQAWFNSLNGNYPTLELPRMRELCSYLSDLEKKYHRIVLISHSSQLSPLYATAVQAADFLKNPGGIAVLDSQNIGVGLGFIVQAAAQASLHLGTSRMAVEQISQIVRSMLAHVYTVFFLPNISFLANSGYLDPAQAKISEMIGITPFYVLESGRLISIHKARNPRQIIDMLYEFVTEFPQLRHIALMQGYPTFEQEIRGLRERIVHAFPSTPLTEHILSTSLLSLLGPHSLGLSALEN
jgi:DegV family protein with EDD domain